jgi:hypothetical protein
LAQQQLWNQKNEKKNFEISIKTEATLAQQQLWNQENEKKNFEISINIEAALAQQQVWIQKNEKKALKFQSKLKQPWPNNNFRNRSMKKKH